MRLASILPGVLFLSVGLLLAGGCAAERRATAFPVDCGRFGEGIKIINGTVEVVIAPKIGRVIHYGFEGGENVLFMNPSKPDAIPDGKYGGWGGDQAWIWPQAEWPKLIGRIWPPAAELDGKPWKLEIAAKDLVRLTSETVPAYGMRIERTFRLDTTGTRLTTVTRLVKVDDKPASPAAAWTVTQIPVPASLGATLIAPAAKTENYYQLLNPLAWKSITRNGREVALVRDPAVENKIGLDASELRATIKDIRFTQKLIATSGGGKYAANERAQVYSSPDANAKSPKHAPYLELEFTSPRADFEKGEREASMTLTWELERLTP